MAWWLLFLDGGLAIYRLHYVDYKNNRKRYKKASATWYKNYIAANSRSKIHGKLRMRRKSIERLLGNTIQMG